MEYLSDGWFRALRILVVARTEEFRRIGWCDLRLALRVETDAGDRWYGLVFEGYDLTEAGRLAGPEPFGADCVLAGRAEVWREMLRVVQTNHGADLHHTLNTLSLAGTPMRVEASDQLGADKFYRYQETLQRVFDLTADIGRHVGVDG